MSTRIKQLENEVNQRAAIVAVAMQDYMNVTKALINELKNLAQINLKPLAPKQLTKKQEKKKKVQQHGKRE